MVGEDQTTAGEDQTTAEDGRQSTEDDRPVVLAVDDKERVARSFEIWLRDGYDVLTATDGEEALATMHEGVDVVLLDRHMPNRSGDEVLEAIREEGYDCRVAMVTGVNPDFDIVAMEFDEYVQKPLDEATLRETVERLVRLDTYDDQFDELYRLSEKRATLEAEKPSTELQSNAEYQTLLDRQTDLRASLDETVADADEETLRGILADGADSKDDG